MSNIGKIMELARELSLGNLAKKQNRYLENATESDLLFLERVLLEEIYLRNERKKATIEEKSHLPMGKYFMNFDIGLQPKVSPLLVIKLKGEEWIEDGFNVLVLGKAGVGKTHFVSAIGYAAVENKRKVFYTTLKDLIFYLTSQNAITKSKNKLKYIRECMVLIIDEFGYVPISNEEGIELYNFINSINKYTSIVIATNRHVKGWDRVFGDEVLASTVADRFLQKCQVVKMTGDSYRLTQSSGFVK